MRAADRTIFRLLQGGLLGVVAPEDDNGVPVEELELQPPIARPGKILCIGLNYRAHAEEQGKDAPETPTIFAKFANALSAPGATVELPRFSDRVDYEAEVAFVIADRCKDVPADEAMDHVAGYTLFNDLSARDYQFKTPQWMPGKVFDGAAPCGPALVTPDEAGSPRRDRDRAALERRADAVELDRRPRPLDSRARGLPLDADDARARRSDRHRDPGRGGQHARPQGLAARPATTSRSARRSWASWRTRLPRGESGDGAARAPRPPSGSTST